MTHAGRVRLVVAGAAFIVVSSAATVYLGFFSSRASIVRLEGTTTAGLIGLAVCIAVLAAIVLLRRPANRMGWVFAALASMLVFQNFATTYLRASFAPGAEPLPGAVPLGVVNLAGPAAFWMIIAFVLFLFPSGDVPSGRWRVVARLAAGVYVATMVVTTFSRTPIGSDNDGPINPLAIDALAAVAESLGDAFWAASNLLVVVAAASLVARYRAARGVERKQLQWLAVSGVFVVAGGMAILAGVVANAGEGLFTVAGVLFGAGLVSVPLFATLAILRYRLYDIDRILSRTLSYAMLSGVLGLLYAGAVFVLTAVVASIGGGSEVAVAGATLAVAAAFRPARARVQHLVNRRFNRARYDAERTVQGFAERLRDRVDVDAVTGDLLSTTIGVVQPVRAQLWLRQET